MQNKWKESKFFKKLKQVPVNRAVYLTSVVILLALAVVLTVTAATNRAKQVDASQNTTAPLGTLPTPSTSSPDSPTIKPEPIPELALPTVGKLLTEHSVDVQVFSPTMQDWRVHLGVDIATEAGAPVCAVAAGTVSQIWEDPMMGWCVAVSHAGDCVTVYKNLAKDLAEGLNTGKTVAQGELLGYVGDTALMEIAEEPHLHMEMTVAGL